ncbi:hypothetical protein [Amycolatopsis samaneae]|uniref:Uncharacterized protein n=1 Tax=Amycolatopsis samaneae TaxID=664691 RepID=A0ABW5GAZ1_9PSEU
MRSHARRTVLGAIVLATASALVAAPAAQASTAGFTATDTKKLLTTTDLEAITTAGEDGVWAVGTARDSPFVARWGGQAWKSESWTPSVLGGLSAVAAAGPSDVWAVGTRLSLSRQPLPLFMHDNGSGWTTVAGPPDPEGGGHLRSVAVAAPDDVWAVGTAGPDATPRPYAAHWDGQSWQEVTLPDKQSGALSSVTAAGPDDVWVTGEADVVLGTGQARKQAIVAHWDGQRWTDVPPAEEPGAPEGILPIGQRISAAAPDQVWLVGQIPQTSRTVVQRWNGSEWTRGPALPAEQARPGNAGLSADPSGVTWVSNSAKNSVTGKPRPVFARWCDGQWTDVPVPSTVVTGNGGAVATTADGATTWALVRTGTTGTPVVLRYNRP